MLTWSTLELRQAPATACKSGTQPKPYGGHQHTEQANEKTLQNGSHTEPTSTANNYWFWRPNLNITFDGRNGFSANVTIDNPYTPGYNSVFNMTASILRVIPDEYYNHRN